MWIRTTFKIMAALLVSNVELTTDGSANLMWNGEKAYYKGGGWWRFHCYSGRGPAQIKAAITDLTRSGKPCKDCGKLTICLRCFDCARKNEGGLR